MVMLSRYRLNICVYACKFVLLSTLIREAFVLFLQLVVVKSEPYNPSNRQVQITPSIPSYVVHPCRGCSNKASGNFSEEWALKIKKPENQSGEIFAHGTAAHINSQQF